LLGRPFSVGGEVVAGSGLGRAKTVPTLNLAPVDQQLPRNGVYVTYTRIAEARHPSVTNVGYKPTFGDHPLTVESFLLDVTDDACAETMEIEFLFRLRDEKKFPDAAALKAQIMQDVRRTRRYFHLCELLSAAGSRQEGGKVRAC
jgi:riboflavin kinase/FMN adenylyltransferase